MVVVVLAPDLDPFAGVGQAHEPVHVQALVAKLAVEALDEGVLHGLARLDEVRPSANVSAMKSIDQRSFDRFGIGRAGWRLSKTKKGFLVQGSDEVGACHRQLKKLAER